jgi:hypothetical protein
MLQPSDLTREKKKKKKKIKIKYNFSFYCKRETVSTVGERVDLKLHPVWYYDTMETKM